MNPLPLSPVETSRLAAVLLHFLWQGAILFAATAAARALHRGQPEARYAAGLVGLIAMLLAPLLTYAAIGPQGAPPGPWTPSPVAGTSAAAAAGHGSTATAALPSWPLLVVAAWAVGASGCAGHSLLGGLWLRRLRRRGTVAPLAWRDWLAARCRQLGVACPRLVLTSRPVTPLLVGWLRPTLLLPLALLSGLAPGQVEALLTHELVHLRRRDHLVNLLQVLLETLLFYHPAVWALSRDLRHDRELCCDHQVAQLVGRPAYARALLAAEELRQTLAPPLALSATASPFLERMRHLTRTRTEGADMRRALRSSLSIALLTLTTGVAMGGLAAVGAASTPSADNETARVFAEISGHGIVRLTAIGGGTDPEQVVRAVQAMATAFGVDVVYLQGKTDSVAVDGMKRQLEAAGLTTSVRMETPAPPSQTLPATFDVELTAGDTVSAVVLDIQGQAQHTLFKGYLAAGKHTLDWRAEDYKPAAGVYFVAVRGGQFRQFNKVVVFNKVVAADEAPAAESR